jgi:hypothetical protein
MTVPPAIQNTTVRPGEILAGKYRVDRVLGLGGMGVVVAAHHLQLDQHVAIKFLLPQAMANPDTVMRFIREARAAVKIQSEHVARVIDVGQLETGAPYLIMEYLEGLDLSQWLRQHGAMGVDQAVEFVLQACEAIAEAHALGIVHRDLKPANLFCIRRPDGLLSIKVLDFGISKMTTLGGSGAPMDLTRTASIVGSPLYMSPEQMHSSRAVDRRTDIWALGVVLFELVTGATPFQAEAMPELVLKVAGAEPLSLRAMRPDVLPGFELIVRRCLEKDRERRFPQVADLAVALRDYGPPRSHGSIERIQGTTASARTPGVPSGPGPSTGRLGGMAVGAMTPGAAPGPPYAGTSSSWGTTAAPGRSTKAILGVVLAFVVVAGGTLIAARRLGRDAPPLPPVTAAVSSPATPSVPARELLAPLSPVEAGPPAQASAVAPPNPLPTPPLATATVTATHLGPTRPASVPTAQPARAKVSCDPPYFIDPSGNRKYKAACL